MITGIDTFLILTPNYNNAILFHRDTLGLPIVMDIPGMTVFEAGETTITVARADEEAEPLLSLMVDDLQQAIDRLQEAGIVFDSPPEGTADGAAFATFRAPGGARYGLFSPAMGGA